jgi:predicted RNA-binding protein with PUA-like domain
MIKQYWLMKSEPNECSVDDVLAMPNQTVAWFGVRNYQARNFMRDDMQIGDEVLFWHSSCANPGIVGLAQVASAAYPDPTQFDTNSHYYDPKSTLDKPRWLLRDIQVIRKIPYLSIQHLRQHPLLENMRVLQKGNRLSITPITPTEWQVINQLRQN